jgi:subfamily B ATP-binding cassette protein MsbA
MADEEPKKKRFSFSKAWSEARDLIYQYRYRLALGGVLMIISRLAGLVLPASSKYLVDEIIIKERFEMLKWIALAIGISTLVQGVTSFTLSQVLGVAAQRAITEMRKKVQAKIERLPISYFDSTQSGQLISRIMNDADGIRNLVGTGLVQLAGSILTALISVCVLFYLNWRLTLITIVVLSIFGGILAYAFNKLRPIFRERNQINAEVTGRLTESLGGIRIVKAYTAERREELSFARGAHRLFRNIAKSLTGVSAVTAFSSLVIGAISVVMIVVGGNAVMAGSMTLGDLFMYIFFTSLMAFPIIELTSIGTQITDAFAWLRSHPRGDGQGDRRRR